MSIATAIASAQQKVESCYSAISNKGGTLPATQDLSNMPNAILGIPSGGTVINNQNKTINTNGSYSADSGYTGLGTVTVQVPTVNNTTVTVTPTTSSQSLTPSSPYTGYSSVSVNAVTASIDSNITAGNIKDGVTILGVQGTYTGGGSAKYGITINNILGTIDNNGVYHHPTETAPTLDLTGVKTTNEKSAFEYMFAYKTLYKINAPDLEYILSSGTSMFASTACPASGLSDVALYAPKLKLVTAGSAFQSTFRGATTAGEYTTFNLNSLEYINANSCLYYTFNGLPIKDPVLPKLLVAIGSNVLYGIFASSTYIDNVDNQHDIVSFPLLCATDAATSLCNGSSYRSASFGALCNILRNTALANAFASCKKLTSVYFYRLNSDSFSTFANPLGNMFNSSTAADVTSCTVHFPANAQSTIQSMSAYPLFGGASGKIVLAFDLPNVTTKTLTFSYGASATSHVFGIYVNGVQKTGTTAGLSATSFTVPTGVGCLSITPAGALEQNSAYSIKINGQTVGTNGYCYCKFEVGSTTTTFYNNDGTAAVTINNSTTMDISFDTTS